LLCCAVVAGCDDEQGYDETTHLLRYASCSQLEEDIENLLIEEVDYQIDLVGRDWCLFCAGVDAAAEGAGDDGGASPPPREEGVDYSGTNNQENGVDEADLVKTDGYHVYALNGNRLHIFGTPEFGDLVPEGVIVLEGRPVQMLLDRDAQKAAVFSLIRTETLPEYHPMRGLAGRAEPWTGAWWYRSSAITKISVIDIADRAAPRLVREVYFEGQYQTAREIDGTVRIATHAWFDQAAVTNWWALLGATGSKEITRRVTRQRIRELALADFIPQLFVRTPDGRVRTDRIDGGDCAAFYRPTDSHGRGVSSIITFDLFADDVRWQADHVLSNPATFYASTDKLVLAEAAHDWWWSGRWQSNPEHLNVHVFDIAQPGETRYTGSGRIAGRLADQFAIDEEDGYIRLATSNRGRDGNTLGDNQIWVLGYEPSTLGAPSWTTVGHLGGIAPGEQITGVRMIGKRGFVVTFRQVDPLWTIDLSDPTRPRIVGELEIPGFSTYIHPLGNDHLLTIGVGGDENGANWITTVSLFDVTDFASPALAESLPLQLEGGWGWSEALREHKAFTYWAPDKLLAIPQSTYAYDGTYRYYSRLEVIEADVTGLRRRGAIDHSPYFDSDQSYYWASNDIRRSIFMGDFIYAISDRAITVHRSDDLSEVHASTLPGTRDGEYWWWW
jgi:hypothetical protein